MSAPKESKLKEQDALVASLGVGMRWEQDAWRGVGMRWFRVLRVLIVSEEDDSRVYSLLCKEYITLRTFDDK